MQNSFAQLLTPKLQLCNDNNFAGFFLAHMNDKIFEKWKHQKNFDTKQSICDFNGICRYLQLENTSGIEIEMLIHKGFAIDLLKDMAKMNHIPWSDRVKTHPS